MPRRSYFNPRTREGCDYDYDRIQTPLRYFNPRTREGCDWSGGTEMARPLLISIHAPVKGATVDMLSAEPAILISIHAPVKGATFDSGPGL